MRARSIGLAVAFPLLVCAQAPPEGDAARAYVQGVVLERDPQVASGELSVRAGDDHVLRYRFDAKTYVEREMQHLDVAHLRPGDRVAVVSDPVSGSPLRYARSIRVTEAAVPPHMSRTHPDPWAEADRDIIDDPWFSPRGNLTFSGVVFRVTPEHVVLHTRTGDETILLRSDTRFLENGDRVDAASLKPNLRVFIRAGKDLYNEVEAYQVIWGEMVGPK